MGKQIGRPPKHRDEKQSCSVQIYCTPQQKQKIVELARGDDRSISSFIVHSILKKSER